MKLNIRLIPGSLLFRLFLGSDVLRHVAVAASAGNDETVGWKNSPHVHRVVTKAEVEQHRPNENSHHALRGRTYPHSNPPGWRRLVESKTNLTCVDDNTLRAGKILHRTEAICDTIYDAFGLSDNGIIVWLMADDSGSVQTLWQAPIEEEVDVLKMQADGNLVARNSRTGKVVWRSGTTGHPASALVAECNLPSCRIFIAGDDLSWEIKSSNDVWPFNRYVCRGDTITSNGRLGEAEFLCAGEYRFGMIWQGTLTFQRIVSGDSSVWKTIWKVSQGGAEGNRMNFLNGNLAVRDTAGKTVWSSKTGGNPNSTLTLFNGGNVKITKPDGSVLWEANVDSELLSSEYRWDCVGDSLAANESLSDGEFICKGDQTVGLADGTLIAEEFDGLTHQWRQTFKATLWTGGHGVDVAMQEDGDLVIYSKLDASGKREALWSFRTNGHPGAKLGFFREASYSFYHDNPVSVKLDPTDVSSLRYISDPESRCVGDKLMAGSRLTSGDLLCNGEGESYQFGMDSIGDLAKWSKQDRNDKLWSAATGGRYSNYAVMEANGNLVVSTHTGIPLWSSNTTGNPGAWLQVDEDGMVKIASGNHSENALWTAAPILPEPTCLYDPVAAGHRFNRNELLCDGIGSFGLDTDGRLTRTSKAYYLTPALWSGVFYDMGGKFGDYASFEKNGNFVVYRNGGGALWSTRTDVGYPKETINYKCYSRGICELEFSSSTEEVKEWSYQMVSCRGQCLQGGKRINAMEFLCSANNGHRFGIDENGDLAVWLRGRKVVTIRSTGSYATQLVMGRDANLVLRDFKGKPVWSSGTNSPGISNDSQSRVCIDDAGVLTVYKSSGAIQIFPAPPPSVFKMFGNAIERGGDVGQFGSSAAISFDGKMLILGSDQSSDEYNVLTGLPGFVNLYSLSTGGSWDALGPRLVGEHPNDRFGASVAFAETSVTDEVIIAVGAPQHNWESAHGPGQVQVFRLGASGIWESVGQKLVGANTSDAFGAQVALSRNGKVLAVVASNYDSTNIGYTKVYVLSETEVWVERGEIPGWKYDATSLDMSGDGSIIAVGDPNDSIQGSVRAYGCSDEDGCQPLGQVIEGVDYEDETGSSISMSESGQFLAIGAPGSYECVGRDGCSTVKVYGRQSDKWSMVGQELSGGIDFGQVVKISANASTLAVQIPFPSDDPWYYEPAKTMVQLYRLRDGGFWRPDGAPIPDRKLLDMSRDGTTLTTVSNSTVINYRYTG